MEKINQNQLMAEIIEVGSASEITFGSPIGNAYEGVSQVGKYWTWWPK